MPAIYKFTAWWGGQEGSLLLWSWLLATYSAIATYTNRRKFRDMMPIVIAIMMATAAFFIGMITFVASPFQVLMAGRGIIDVGDGQGLSPLLQWWTMAIHPPFLYLGYVGFTVPFAFAMASLLTRQSGEGWIHTTRRWAILTVALALAAGTLAAVILRMAVALADGSPWYEARASTRNAEQVHRTSAATSRVRP